MGRHSITKTCTIGGCRKRYEARGMCPMHYSRFRKHGSPNTSKLHRYDSKEEKLMSNIEIPRNSNECWLWTNKRSKLGYGKFYWRGKSTSAHRAFYKTFVDSDIDGLDVDHLCKNPPCVNPTHLEPVTSRENTLRGTSPPALNIKKTHCKQGHEYSVGNTRLNKNGGRSCKKCGLANWRRLYREHRAAGIPGYH